MPWRCVFYLVPWVLVVALDARAQMINEILFDPHSEPSLGDANGDGQLGSGDDEFVEIVNEKPIALDLSGWTLSDATTVRHVFPAGTIVAPRCAIVVFGGGSPMGEFGGATVQVASTGALGLNNWGDSIRLKNHIGLVTEYTYGMGIADQSVTREPDFGPEPLVPHSGVAGSQGLQSPGTALNGEAFPGCRGVGSSSPTWGAVKALYRPRQP